MPTEVFHVKSVETNGTVEHTLTTTEIQCNQTMNNNRTFQGNMLVY